MAVGETAGINTEPVKSAGGVQRGVPLASVDADKLEALKGLGDAYDRNKRAKAKPVSPYESVA